METVIVGLTCAAAAVVLVFLTAQSYVLERRAVYRTLRTARATALTPEAMRERQLALPMYRRVVQPGLQRLARAARRLTPASVHERIATELRFAGDPEGWDAERVIGAKLVSAVAFGVAATATVRAPALGSLRAGMLVVLFAAWGYYVPELVLRSRSRARQDAIRGALPDSLDLLSMMARAGLSFDAAVARAGREIRGPLGEELSRVVRELRLGRSRSDALRDLADRSTAPELHSFVVAMIQADALGSSIAQVLSVQADEMRVKRRQRAEKSAQKVPVKIVFPVVLCIFPALFVTLLGPAALSVYRELGGRL